MYTTIPKHRYAETPEDIYAKLTIGGKASIWIEYWIVRALMFIHSRAEHMLTKLGY